MKTNNAVQWFKPLPTMLTWSPSCSAPDPLPAHVPGKQAKMAQFLMPCMHPGDLDEASDSFCLADPDVADICGMKQQVENLPLCLFFSVCDSVSQIN